MRYTIAIFLATASAALFSATPAKAADNRVLVNFTDYSSGAAFCNAWRCNCINYVPTDSSLSFQGAYCNPGDYQGKNTNSVAKVFCE